MRGCRPLTELEVSEALHALKGDMRAVALFILGIRTGYRISELLSLKVRDVMQFGRIVDKIVIKPAGMKGKKDPRSVAVHPDAKEILQKLIESEQLTDKCYLFKSSRGHNRPLSRCQAWRILKNAYNSAELSGPLATHTMRKTFAERVHSTFRDIFKTQRALGHKNLDSTASYLSFDEKELDEVILTAK